MDRLPSIKEQLFMRLSGTDTTNNNNNNNNNFLCANILEDQAQALCDTKSRLEVTRLAAQKTMETLITKPRRHACKLATRK